MGKIDGGELDSLVFAHNLGSNAYILETILNTMPCSYLRAVVQ